MAESESSSSSSQSEMASEIQEEHGLIVAETRVSGLLQPRDGLQGNDTSPANTKEAERHDAPKQPRVIKNIIKALKEGKGREITSKLQSETPQKIKARHEVTTPSSAPAKLVPDTEPSCKRALDRTPSFHARTDKATHCDQHAKKSSHFRDEIMQHCRARGIDLASNARTPSSSSSSPSKKHHKNSEDHGEETRRALRMEIPSPNLLASDEDFVLVSPATDASSSVTTCRTGSDSSLQANAAAEEAGAKEAKSFSERADALEGLLELCADLLEQSKLEELAVVLKPFGKEKVSPRDTAMWLAKSLKGMMIEESGRLA